MKNRNRLIAAAIIGSAIAVAAPATAPAHAATTAPTCIACVGGVSVKYTKLSHAFISKKHVRYLTPTWQKASQYTWTTTTTATATMSSTLGTDIRAVSASLGVSYSRSKAYAVGVTIPANKYKYSKLALKADYNRYYVKKTVTLGGRTTTSYGYLYSPTSNQYLVVTYQ